MLGKASQLFVCLFQETLSGYQGPLVGGAADFPGFVKSGHLEGDDFPGDAGDLRSARTSSPTGVAEVWARSRAMPTEVCPSSRAGAMASQAAPSIRAAMQGVA